MAKTESLQTATRTVRRAASPAAQRIEVDVAVLGAGMAGVSAALEAARLGRRVALIDCAPTLGGQSVNALIGTFCGLFSNGDRPYRFTYGIADGILRDLGNAGALHTRRGGINGTIVMYDEVVLARWIEDAVRAAGITVLLGALLRHVAMEGRRVRELALTTRFGDVRLGAAGFVDASGDAALAWGAGLACREPEQPIYGSQMIVIEGIDESAQPTREALTARLKDKAEGYGLVRHSGFAFAFPGKGTALVNMTHVETPLDAVAFAQKSLDGKAQADATVDFLRKEFPQAFGQARVRSYGTLGIRQTRWIAGRRQLSVDDVRAGTRFPDAIARTSWPIELHDQEQEVTWEGFGEDHVHFVPMGALTPAEADNLVAAGRCIDGDVAALSSVRVMGPCIAMGAAAAHALDLAGAGSVHQIDIAALQERVRDNLERRD
jgi:FAD-dependent oxidoreductase family protein